MVNKYMKQLNAVIRTNLEQRGMDKVELTEELERSAKELLEGTTIFIVTGFVIRDTLTGETDGPIGAVSLAGALEQLGKKVILITDRYSRDMLYHCIKTKNLEIPVEIMPYGKEKEFSNHMLLKYRPSHVVAVERPGRAADGKCYSMRGEDLSDLVPNTDILFEESKKRQITSIAVGDGGNEIGMGRVRDHVVASVHRGREICAVLCTDYLVVAGVSNWGGHALAAALSLLTKKMLLHNAGEEIKLLKGMVAAGAVDGCTKKREMTVDGLCLEENLNILQLLRNVVEAYLLEHQEAAESIGSIIR
ncbi:MAG: DUF4392 domain-containing protein [Bacillota bacterium]